MLEKINSLNDLWNYTIKATKKNYPDNDLMPILGGGREKNPRFMIVFINPTIRNISSNKNWKGPRFPFIGRKRPWLEFYKSELFDRGLLDIIQKDANWSVEFTNKVLKYLKQEGLYITNIVKNTGYNADLPKADQINTYLPIFKKEIEIINPKYIIAFGLIPLNALLDEKIKLSNYYNQVTKSKKIKSYNLKINSHTHKIIPCYYPIGRGNPTRAIKLLKLINKTCK